jgi:His/Glu/Gln/Arg/opine family amino acid ABC transporter permease subunit
MAFNFNALIQYYPEVLQGLHATLYIVAISLAIGIVVGLVACVGKLSGSGIGCHFWSTFIDIFRTVPEFVLIFWVYYCLPLLFDVGMSATVSGVVALSLLSSAVLAEVFRAGILAVPRSQLEAAAALAIPTYHKWRYIILPQAVRRMMPAFMNFLTELLKASALLSAIGVPELLYKARNLGDQTFRHLEFFTLAAVLYFVVIFPLSMYARRAELRLSKRTGQ